MSAQVVSFFRLARSRDWAQNELAQFYRVEAALVQAGLQIETDKGVTDEGDPWFVFCRRDNGDVFMHFARIGGVYIAAGATLERVSEGLDFPALVEEMLASQALGMARARRHSDIFLHPAALLIALVGGAFFHSSQAKAEDAVREPKLDQRGSAAPVILYRTQMLLGDGGETTPVLAGLLKTTPGLAGTSVGPVINLPALAGVAVDAFDQVPSILQQAAVQSAVDPSGTLFTQPVTSDAAHTSAATHLIAPNGEVLFSHTGSSVPGAFVTMPDHTVGSGAELTLLADLGPKISIVVAPPSAAILAPTLSSQAGVVLQAANVASTAEVQSNAPSFAVDPALKSYLDTGLHVTVIALGTAPSNSAVEQGASAGDRYTASGAGGANDSTAASLAGDSATLPASLTPPVTTVGTPSVPAVPDGLSANSPQVTAAIQHFSAEVAVLDIANVAHGAVLYDGSLFTSAGSVARLDTVTFTFADGSSISLVGTPTEIQNLHLA